MPIQTYKNFIAEQCHKNPTFYNISVGSIEEVLAHIDVILSAAMEDWNNATNHTALCCPPMIFPLSKGQDSNTAKFAITLKMDSDRDTVVYSPILLPYLKNQWGGVSIKLNCKCIDFAYTPDEEIFTFPDESGLPFLFGVEKELTTDPTAIDTVGKMLDEAEKLAEKARAAIETALADEDSRYHSVVTFFMGFHRDGVGPDIAAGLFPGTDPSELSFAEMVDFLRLKRFGNPMDDEMGQRVFIMDLFFNPEITDRLMATCFDLNQEILCITRES